jgi:hypothetical protein
VSARTAKFLAEVALPVPWKTSPPYSALADFRAAVTPELFLELVGAVAFAVRFFDQLTPADAERMRAVLDKATGGSQ